METNCSMKNDLKNKKIFEKPDLEIIKFEGDLATEDPIATSSFGDPDPETGDVLQGHQ